MNLRQRSARSTATSLVVVCLIAAGTLPAAVYTWSGGDGRWSSGWIETGYPSQPDDEAVIDGDQPATVLIDVPDAMVGRLTINATASCALDGDLPMRFATEFDGAVFPPARFNADGARHVINTPIAIAADTRLDVTAEAGARAVLRGVIGGGPAGDIEEAVYVTGAVEITGANTYPGITRVHNTAGTVLYTTVVSVNKVRLPASAGGSSTANKLVLINGGIWTPAYNFGSTILDARNDLYYGAQPWKPPSISASGAPLTISLKQGTGGSNRWRNNGTHSANMGSGGWWPWGCDELDTRLRLTDPFELNGSGRSMLVYQQAGSDGYLEFAGRLYGGAVHASNPSIILGGGGTLEISYPDNEGWRNPIQVNSATLRVNSRIGDTNAYANANDARLNHANARLAGHGRLHHVWGYGLIDPGKDGASPLSPGANAGVLTIDSIDPTLGATPAASMRFAFEFGGVDPDYGTATNSRNDVLRLAAADPFTGKTLTGNNTVSLYFNRGIERLDYRMRYRGGFYTDAIDAAALQAAITNAGFVVHARADDGAVTYHGKRYTVLTPKQYPMYVSAIPATADFGDGVPVNGAVMTVSYLRAGSTLVLR